MLKDLIKVANKLDSLGLSKEADLLDSLINKIASDNLEIEPEEMGSSLPKELDYVDESIFDLKTKIKNYYGDRLPSIDFLEISPETMTYYVEELPEDKEELYRIISDHVRTNDWLGKKVLDRDDFLAEMNSLKMFLHMKPIASQDMLLPIKTSSYKAILRWLSRYEEGLAGYYSLYKKRISQGWNY
jgi:hypothetical protein